MDTFLIFLVGFVLFLMFVFPYYRKQKKLEAEALVAEEEAIRYGLKEPATLHPIVDPGGCIGTGNCVAICPEKNVLGLVSGQARPISPARCIGHGLCERSCPTEAIQLVFGTDKRGVDLPRIQENFETNVPGIYIVGELGGMGLVRNAFEQGRQCVEGIRKEGGETPHGFLDVLIVGCGPAGLSTAVACQQAGLDFQVLEKEDVGGTVRTYPRKKLVMTQPLVVPGYGKLNFREILKEDLIDLWNDMILKTGIEVRIGETVEAINPVPDGGFEVTSSRETYFTRRVILAIGRRGVPRKLNIPGEASPNVSYSLREPEAFQNDRIVVVGGGDSAVEAALALSDQPGNRVSMSYRKDRFSRIKSDNLSRIEAAQADGSVNILWVTNLTEISSSTVYVGDDSGNIAEHENDYVFIFAGGMLPTPFLRSCGIRIDTKFGEPTG